MKGVHLLNVVIVRVVPGKDFLRHKKWSLNKSSKLIADGGDVLPIMIARGALLSETFFISDAAKLSLVGGDVIVRNSCRSKDSPTLVVVYGQEILFATTGLTLGSYVSAVTWSYKFAGKTSVFALFARIVSPGETLSLFVEGSPFLVKKTDDERIIAEFARTSA